MLNLLLSVLARHAAPARVNDGFLGKLLLWTRRQFRYNRALAELRRLDQRDLDDLNLGRADLPLLAHLHAVGAAPVLRLR